MDARRAKEIMESYGVIEVLFNGRPIWIEDIQGASVVATYIGSDNRIELPVNKLTEGDPVQKF